MFGNLLGLPDFRLLDLLFVKRAAQGRVLGCEPGQVVPQLAALLRCRTASPATRRR